MSQNISQEGAKEESQWAKENFNLGDEDFEELLELEQDIDGWEHTTSKNGIDLWKTKVEGSSLYLIKGRGYLEGITPATAYEAVCNTPVRLKWDEYVQESWEVDRKDEDNVIMYYAYKSPSVVADRDFLQCRSVKFDYPDEGDIMVLYRSIEHDDCPLRDNFVRAHTQISAQIYRKSGEDTELTIFSHNDLKGDIPTFVINMVAAQAPLQWYGSLHNGCLQLLDNPEDMRESVEGKKKRMAKQRQELLETVFSLTESESGRVVAHFECTHESSKGELIVSEKHVCFYSAQDNVAHVVELHTIGAVQKKSTNWFFGNALSIEYAEGELTFKDFDHARDAVHETLQSLIETYGKNGRLLSS